MSNHVAYKVNVVSSVVLVANIVPSLVVQMIAPYFMNWFPFSVRVVFSVSTNSIDRLNNYKIRDIN